MLHGNRNTIIAHIAASPRQTAIPMRLLPTKHHVTRALILYPLNPSPIVAQSAYPHAEGSQRWETPIKKHHLRKKLSAQVQTGIGFQERLLIASADKDSFSRKTVNGVLTSIVCGAPPTAPCWEAAWAGQQVWQTARRQIEQNVLAVQGTPKSTVVSASR